MKTLWRISHEATCLPQWFSSIKLHRPNYHIIQEHSIIIFITLSMKLNYNIGQVHLKISQSHIFLDKESFLFKSKQAKQCIWTPPIHKLEKSQSVLKRCFQETSNLLNTFLMCCPISTFNYLLKAPIEFQDPLSPQDSRRTTWFSAFSFQSALALEAVVSICESPQHYSHTQVN